MLVSANLYGKLNLKQTGKVDKETRRDQVARAGIRHPATEKHVAFAIDRGGLHACTNKVLIEVARADRVEDDYV